MLSNQAWAGRRQSLFGIGLLIGASISLQLLALTKIILGINTAISRLKFQDSHANRRLRPIAHFDTETALDFDSLRLPYSSGCLSVP
jgi:hypothetical protein